MYGDLTRRRPPLVLALHPERYERGWLIFKRNLIITSRAYPISMASNGRLP